MLPYLTLDFNVNFPVQKCHKVTHEYPQYCNLSLPCAIVISNISLATDAVLTYPATASALSRIRVLRDVERAYSLAMASLEEFQSGDVVSLSNQVVPSA